MADPAGNANKALNADSATPSIGGFAKDGLPCVCVMASPVVKA